MGEDDFGECNTCPSNNPLGCSVVISIKELIGRHSGLTEDSPNRMEIQVTKCHHKVRILKENNDN